MWTVQSNQLTETHGLRFLIEKNGKTATFADVLNSWRSDQAFRSMYTNLLAGAPFSAFRWETPAVTLATLSRSFEFVLLDSPSLTRQPEPEAFAKYFNKSPDAVVEAFPNLGGDAILIAPRQKTLPTAYIHLASFVRDAPEAQHHALWELIGETMLTRVSSNPIWLNTAGAGVAWLHIRLDDRPKYYGFAPYRQFASKPI